jgi:putative transcriptional regulator
MLRVRLKADGRIVEVLADGSERAMAPADGLPTNGAHISPLPNGVAPTPSLNGGSGEDAAAYARRIRGATRLSQNDFATRIGVPVETVRNWEQGKRAPRGPGRALLRVIDSAPETALTILGGKAIHR